MIGRDSKKGPLKTLYTTILKANTHSQLPRRLGGPILVRLRHVTFGSTWFDMVYSPLWHGIHGPQHSIMYVNTAAPRTKFQVSYIGHGKEVSVLRLPQRAKPDRDRLSLARLRIWRASLSFLYGYVCTMLQTFHGSVEPRIFFSNRLTDRRLGDAVSACAVGTIRNLA